MLLSAALILLSGLILGETAGKLHLPKLTGMLAAGLILGSLGSCHDEHFSRPAENRPDNDTHPRRS